MPLPMSLYVSLLDYLPSLYSPQARLPERKSNNDQRARHALNLCRLKRWTYIFYEQQQYGNLHFGILTNACNVFLFLAKRFAFLVVDNINLIKFRKTRITFAMLLHDIPFRKINTRQIFIWQFECIPDAREGDSGWERELRQRTVRITTWIAFVMQTKNCQHFNFSSQINAHRTSHAQSCRKQRLCIFCIHN